ncbi:MAG: hypothetical protein Q9225_002403 [Loekoesia sp. 1 TL-2023]
MSIPYFASAFGQSRKGHVGDLQPKLSRKRKRGAQYPEEPNIDESESPPDEHPRNDNASVEAATTFRPSSSAGLRRQHFSVLTSLLHRCILAKDYQRAGRAWGMLLRTEANGHPFDIRAQERWGIGAELLLHGGTSLTGQSVNEQDSVYDAKSIQNRLMKTKDYYERLILQFPYRKTAPDTTSSLTFYPAMFGVWIHSIQLRYKIAMQATRGNRKSRQSAISNNNTNSIEGDSDSSINDAQTDGHLTVYQLIIQDVNEVLERLNELLTSPPYSDHSGLWKIRAMLYLWAGQLLDQASVSQDYSDGSGGEFRSTSGSRQSSHAVTEPAMSHQNQWRLGNNEQERRETYLKAREAFSRALALGDTLDTRTRQEVGL